jgi:glucan phosphoethanolaminetransferase (alkaline phosphatase superfamily)
MHLDPASWLSIALGIGLAAATGLRVFLPLLIAGLASNAGWIPLADSFGWLSTTPALVMLGTAAVVETFAYYVPGFDHLLDLLAGPAAVVAGIVASASVMTDVPPAIMWPVAIIAGGGLAGLTKGTAAVIRAKGGLVTGGLANPVVSTAETMSAAVISMLAIVVPILCAVLILALVVWMVRKARRLTFGSRRGERQSW